MDEQQSVDYARELVSNIIAFFGENLEVKSDINDDTILIYVESSAINSILIGRNADNMRALQYVVSSALRNNNASLTKVSLDIAGYKKQREEKIAENAKEWIEKVRQTGSSHVAYLSAADRRIVHHVASEYSDIRTYSEGEGRDRRIIISQISS